MPITVVGPGDVGSVFVRAAEGAGEGVRVVRRGDDVRTSSLREGPIVVAVREEDLAGVAGALRSAARRAVFVQNGYVEPILEPLGEITRGLLWFTAKGDFFHVLGPSPFFGPQAESMVALLTRSGIDAVVIDDPVDQVREKAFKLAWSCVVGLPVALRATTLAAYLDQERVEAAALVDEVCSVLSATWGIPISASDAYARLLETTGELGWMTGSTKGLSMRNGAIAQLGRAHGVATPVNDRLLARLQ
ncbi:MAG: hypothetical protein IT379_15375 [Deltaproteobacteria bacterium]|nr:hypothetical protein [Deltaproteobacteria bacterium]